MIYIIRANHGNQFELQNYVGIKNLEVITSRNPLTDINLNVKKLWSPTDLPKFPFRRQLLRRIAGGEQWLIGLDQYISKAKVSSRTDQRTIVHTAETYTPYTHQAVKMRKAGKIDKLVCTCWETIAHNNEKFTYLRRWKKDAYKYVDLFHTPTTRAKLALINEGVDPEKIRVIPYGVDLARFQARDLPGVSRKAVVLTVARLEKEKGMAYLEQVAKSFPGINFVVIGSGSYVPKADNIEIKQISYDSIHKEYQKADIFFLPSHSSSTWEEQYGFALVEAMSCGVPILSTISGAIPEVVGPAGMLVPDGDLRAMKISLKKLLASQALQSSLAKSGAKRAKDLYDAKKASRELSSLYL